MADLITRLKVDSTEYDAKIKRAAQGLQHYVQSAHDSGDVIGRLLGNTKKYVESLGNMATVSTTARGRLNELTAAFTDLRSVYNSLSEEEKSAKGGFGQELNKQLEILKGRINDTKNELKGIDQELGNTKQAEDGAKSGLEGLTSAIGINVKSLAGWGTALAAGKVALDVAKDAFFASESTVDEWGRTIQSAQGLYEGFLNALNTGDISGYLSRMNDIVTAARAAYDELDKLGTMKTIQAPKVSAQQTENERIRSMIQTGRYIAPVDGRRNAVFNGREMQNGDKLTAGQIRALEKQLQNGMQNVVKLVGNEVNQTGKAIDAYYNSMAKQNGMSLQEFKKGTSSWEEFSKKMQGYDDYKKWDKQARTEFAKQGGRGNVDFDKSNPFAEFKKWGVFRVDKEGGNSYKDLVQLIQQRDQQAGQAYSMQSQAYRTMNRAEGFTVSKLMGKGGKGGKTDKNLDAEQQVQKKINELLKEALTADANRQGEIRQQVAELQKQQEKYKDIKNIAQGILPKDKVAVFTIDGQLSEETKKNLREIQGVTIDDKTMTVTAETADALRALQGIEGVTIDPKTVTITATDEALPKLREIQGITIDDKAMTVTAETADALRALQGIEGVTIDPKTVTITATDEALPKLRDIQGITIDDKTMTVTAETQEAMQKVQELIGQVSTATLQMKVAPPDLDKLFPDMSKANFNTGYAGSAQAKYDSARADLALGPMNLDAVNSYISSVKGMLKDANLGDELYTSMTEKLKDATTVSTLLQEMMERGLAGADLESTAQALKEKLLSPEGIDQTAIQSFLDELNKQIEESGGVGLKLNTDTGEVTDDKGKGKDDGEEFKKFNEGVGKLTGGLSSVTSGLKAVGVDIPKEVDQVVGVINGVSQVISGIGTLISLFGAGAMTANTTAVSLNTAAIGGLIAAIEFNTASNFIPFFAGGGIVPHAANGYFVGGNSFSGDNTPIMANAGELVLSKSQQGVLASMLTDEERGGGNAQPYLDGEKIYLGLQAYMRRSGLGEIVTSER